MSPALRADREDRQSHDIRRHVVAGVRNVIGAAHAQPFPMEDALGLERVKRLGGVDPRRQRQRLAERAPGIVGEQVEELRRIVHRAGL